MAILKILEFPDPRLRTVAKPVDMVTDEIRQLTDDMLETMYDAPGIGLAATQIDVHLQVVVIDVSEEKNDPKVFINPKITILDGEKEQMEEGCLSVPGFYETVERSNHVRVQAQDKDGNTFEEEYEDLMAVCIQHEKDHLDGKLFVDYISPLKRTRIKKKLEKQHRIQTKAS